MRKRMTAKAGRKLRRGNCGQNRKTDNRKTADRGMRETAAVRISPEPMIKRMPQVRKVRQMK